MASARLVARQHVGLEGRTYGHHPIRVYVHQGLAPKEFRHPLAHPRHPGGTADHDHVLDLVRRQARIPQGAAAGAKGLLDQGVDQGRELGAGQLPVPDPAVREADTQRDGLRRGQGLLGGAGVRQQAAQRGVIGVVSDPGLGHDPGRDGPVEVVAAQGRVSAGGHHLEDPPAQAQDGDVEGPAAQVIDGVDAIGVAVQAVGEGSGGGLVEQAQDLEPGQGRRVLGGLALGVVEIGRDRDDHAGQVPPRASWARRARTRRISAETSTGLRSPPRVCSRGTAASPCTKA